MATTKQTLANRKNDKVAQKVEQLKLGRAVHRKNWPSSSGGAN